MRKLFAIVIPMLIISGCSNAQDLKTEQVKNLMSFARLFGYVKYFHPSSEAQQIDWNNFAVIGVREILKAKNQDEAEKTLQRLFLPIAPSLLLYKAGEKEPVINFASMKPKDTLDTKVVYWKHTGDGIDNNDTVNIYTSIIQMNNYSENFYQDSVRFGDFIGGSLPNDLKFKMPIALFYNIQDSSTLPKVNKKELNSLMESLLVESARPFSFEDSTYAIANVIITWNTMRHFFPYFDLIKEVQAGSITEEKYWEKKLKEFLDKAINVKSEKEQYELLRKLIAGLKDGHGGVRNDNSNDYYFPDFIAELIEDSVVVAEIKSKNEQDVRPGDIILQIDKEDISNVIKRKDSLISYASDEWRNTWLTFELFRGKNSTDMEIVFTRNGKKFTKTVKRTFYYNDNIKEANDNIKQLNENTFYLNLTTIGYDDFIKKINLLENAKGIIFDLRGYPQKDVKHILTHLTSQELKSSRWMLPIITRPDYQNVKFDTSGRWILQPHLPKLKGKIVFLTNGKAISYSESIMAIVENYKLGEIVGSPTAATNGDINWIRLPGNFIVWYTGLKVLKHDGSRYHGVGVKPTIPVIKTIKGVREGRDEVLEKAIEVIEGK